MFYELKTEEIPKKILSQNSKKRRRNIRHDSQDGGSSIFFDRTEQTTYGLIHEDDDNILCSHGDEYQNCGFWDLIFNTADISYKDTLKRRCELTKLHGVSRGRLFER
jgi:hypothetical protein